MKKIDLYLKEKEKKALKEENDYYINKKNQKMMKDFYDKQVKEKKKEMNMKKILIKFRLIFGKKILILFSKKKKK